MPGKKLDKGQLNIRENSCLAKFAAWKLKSKDAAIVLGNTIHLHNASREDFSKNRRWVNHEICHLEQFKRYGYVGFIIRYLWESIVHGYHNNKFELEARAAECVE